MCICTYLSEGEFTKPTSDKELNALLAEVRQATHGSEDWRIEERTYEVSRWFRRPTTIKLYVLYHMVNHIEFQIINFYRPDLGENSINIMNTAGHVAAYLYGILAAVNQRKEPSP